ncbi:hypothetical protein MBT84_19420 [Streptomyces sp. MBT84]|uniref:hypothetical protein n=1 Tax=Streptomyces sp. MBT84 TaxID=1488414 RepID=UPI001C6E5902|nr:hypothetical protein [Streptomyces sp. MBT84]MBW8701779.1 hypothetical protein [Streptomyces sp. MBT84]
MRPADGRDCATGALAAVLARAAVPREDGRDGTDPVVAGPYAYMPPRAPHRAGGARRLVPVDPPRFRTPRRSRPARAALGRTAHPSTAP